MGYPPRPYQSLHHPLKLQPFPKSLSSFGSIESFDDYNSILTSVPTPLPCTKSKSHSASTSIHLPRRPPALHQPKFVLPNLPENAHRSTFSFPSSGNPTIKLDQNSLNHQSFIDSIRTPTSNLFSNSSHSTRFLEDFSPSSNSNAHSSAFDSSPPSSFSSSSSLSLKPIIKRKSSKLFESLNLSEMGNKKSNSDSTSYSPKSEISSSPKPHSATSLIETNKTHQTSSNNLWWWERVHQYRKNSLDSNFNLTFEKNHIIQPLKKTKNSSKINDWFLILNQQKYHPFKLDKVPYWMSYQHEVLDHHVLMMYACSPNGNPFKTLTKPIGHQKILDLGCGPYGIWCNGVLKSTKNPELELIGLDICPIQLKKLPIQMKFVQHDFLKSPLPFPNQTFDQVNASFLGSGIPQQKWSDLISEIFRILKPGHHLTINETNYDSSLELQRYLNSQTISSNPISIIPSELSLIGTHLKRSKVLFNEIPTSIFQNPILSTLANQRLLLSTRECLMNSSNPTLQFKTKSNSQESKGDMVGLLKEKFNWVCSMDLQIKEILEKRLNEIQESRDAIQLSLMDHQNLLQDFESEIELDMNDQLKDSEIQNKLMKLIHSIEFDLNLIHERLSHVSNFELELDQNSIQIETFSVRTFRDQSLVYV